MKIAGGLDRHARLRRLSRLLLFDLPPTLGLFYFLNSCT